MTWNGWLCPSFSLEQARAIAARLNPHVDENNPPILEIERDGVVVFSQASTYDDESAEEWTPDADGEYQIGAFEWCWDDIEPLGDADMADASLEELEAAAVALQYSALTWTAEDLAYVTRLQVEIDRRARAAREG